jgi:hypothetical protein
LEINMNTIEESKLINGPHQKDVVLTEKEAEVASPEDLSVGGEEDPGVGLEDLVEKH